MKKLLVTLFVFFALTSVAQTLIVPQPVRGFQVGSNDLQNFNVIHTPKEAIQVAFIITVQKTGEGQILEMVSSNHTLRPGVNSFTLSNLNVISKRYSNTSYASYESKMRSFPEGEYGYCIDIICKDAVNKCERIFEAEITHKQCNEFTVIPATPLLLASPEDEALIKETRPNFSWIPPMPLGSDPDIRYSFTLVHLQKDQRPEDGIRRNRPLYQRGPTNNLVNGVNLVFPTTLPDLIKGERYAWQVEAFLNNIKVGTSEVWEFEVEKKQVYSSYVDITTASNNLHQCGSNLDFSYKYRGLEGVLNYQILDSEGEDVSPSKEILVVRGDNYLRINRVDAGLNTDEQYQLKVTDLRGKNYILLFQFFE